MMERFTPGARAVVFAAQEEARRLRQPNVGSEHVLLGLVAADADPVAGVLAEHGVTAGTVRAAVAAHSAAPLDSEALATLGIDLDRVREATEASFGPGALDGPGGPLRLGHLSWDRTAKKTLELGLREALRMGHDSIGTGHLLLGILRDGNGPAWQLLHDIGVDLTALRGEVERLLPADAA
jgi:ATP-dependent Clp protease ATP-binding subunit ClpA